MIEYSIVGSIIALCTLYLLRRFLRTPANGKPECGGCDRCSGKSGGCH